MDLFGLDDNSNHSLSSGGESTASADWPLFDTHTHPNNTELPFIRDEGPRLFPDAISESTNTPSPPTYSFSLVDQCLHFNDDFVDLHVSPHEDGLSLIIDGFGQSTAEDLDLVGLAETNPEPLFLNSPQMQPVSPAPPAPLVTPQHHNTAATIQFANAAVPVPAPLAPAAEQPEPVVSQQRPRKRRREEPSDYRAEMTAVKKEISERTGQMTEAEEKELKKKKRMLKNRISAQQSRDNRRQQLENLQQQVKQLLTQQTEMQIKINLLESENARMRAENSQLRVHNPRLLHQIHPSHNIRVMSEASSLSLSTTTTTPPSATPMATTTAETTHTPSRTASTRAMQAGFTAFVILFACIIMIRLGDQLNNGYGADSKGFVSLPHHHEGGKIFKNTNESILPLTEQDSSQCDLTLLQQRVLYPREMEQCLYGLSRSFDESSATSSAASPISVTSAVVHTSDSSLSESSAIMANSNLLSQSESSSEITVSDGDQEDLVDDIFISAENSIHTISPVVNAVLLSHDERYRYRTLSVGNNQSTSSRQDAQWQEALLFSLAPNKTEDHSADDTMFLLCSDVHPMMTHNARKDPSKIKTITVLLSLGEASHVSGVPMLEYFKGPGALLAQLPTVPITDTNYAFVSVGNSNASSRMASPNPPPAFQ